MPDFTFTAETSQLQFRTDVARRTVSGIVVPYGTVAWSQGQPWRFRRGSLHWTELSRVKLNDGHNIDASFGVATELHETDAGLWGSFTIADVPAGDEALKLAAAGVKDGFSIKVTFEDGDSYVTAADGVNDVYRATLRHTALTAEPAFDDARVASVVASREDSTMTAPATEPTTAPAPAGASTATPPAPPGSPDFAAFTAGLTSAIGEAVAQAFARLGEPQGDGPQVIPAGSGLTVTNEPPVYTLQQSLGAPSFVRDAWKAHKDHDREAIDRLQKFQRQQGDISARVNRAGLQFATGTTGTLAQIIPPGYRPELYVPQLFQGRPLTDSVSKGAISDATPFTIPKFVSATAMAQNHAEGTNATDGTVTMTTVTVTPAVVDGLYKLTREIAESSNPAIDAIALQAMREAYSQNTEAKVYAEINGANGVGGVITAGFVPSGAAARAFTGPAGGAAAAGIGFLEAIRTELAAYPFRRFAEANRAVLAQEGFTALTLAKDGSNRPLLAPLAPQNTAGAVNDLGTTGQGVNVDGHPFRPAWSMTGNAAGDADVIGFNSADVWAWESPTMAFRFEERSGPAIIELALWGHFATKVLRAAGMYAVRLTVTP